MVDAALAGRRSAAAWAPRCWKTGNFQEEPAMSLADTKTGREPAIATATAAAFLAGTAVAGVGFGLALLGVNRTLIALAAPGQRAGLIAAIFIVNFLGLSIPALIAGVATAHIGLHRTALAYCVAMAALVAVAAGSLMLGRRGPAIL
jgi:hypothetical protein